MLDSLKAQRAVTSGRKSSWTPVTSRVLGPIQWNMGKHFYEHVGATGGKGLWARWTLKGWRNGPMGTR